MANSRRRQLANWILCLTIVVSAGVLGGWILRQDDQTPVDEPKTAATAPQPEAPQSGSTPRANRLANETSPYLQLHKHNPVDWYPWGDEAFEKAKREDKPVFLSIGYSSCYWCHVMERESFNDAEIAQTLNKYFVCIKVDREELPDVDEIYMNSVLLMNRGSAGWPLTVFLTADRKPFAGGTYFPPRDRPGMIGLIPLLSKVLVAWQENRAAVEADGDRIAHELNQVRATRGFSFRKLDRQVIAQAVSELAGEFDPEHGGFGFNPQRPRRTKFPQPSKLELLLYQVREAKDPNAQAMLALTLERMSRGGIWDHLGGGFHRYSTDRAWQVPHFEKMLYDNAQLARVYLQAFELTRDGRYAMVASRIFAFVADEMTSPEGGFYSALDAESEHEEGKFYVWTKQEVEELLTPEEFKLFSFVYGLNQQPHLEDPTGEAGRYVLQRTESMPKLAETLGMSPEQLARTVFPIRQKLFAARNVRARPLLDTKIMTDWNGLMIGALADGARILENEKCREAAERGAELVLSKSRDSGGRLLHIYSAGTAKLPAYLEDYTFLIQGLLALHRTTQNSRWLDEAKSLADQMIQLFWDAADGGFYNTASDQPVVLTRMKSSHDSVLPGGNSAAVRVLVALADRTREKRYAELAGKTLAAFANPLATGPSDLPHMVLGLAEYLDAELPAAFLTASRPAAELEVVQAKAVLSLDKLKPGREFQIAVMLDIGSDWHIYANPTSHAGFLPTTLQVTSELPLEDLTIHYPKSRSFRAEGVETDLAVYNGRCMIKVSGKLGDKASAGNGELKLSLRFQACNNQHCLAPKTLDIKLAVEVASADEPIHELFPENFQVSPLKK